MNSKFESLRINSQGYKKDSCAFFHPCILVGAGEFLTPEFIKKDNITHVINCSFDEYSPSWYREQYPFNYVCIEAYDGENVNILDWYPKFRYFLNKYLSEPLSEVVYVHCQLGINRSGFLALTYVCKELGFDIEKMEESVMSQRPCILQNNEFRKQIYEFLANK